MHCSIASALGLRFRPQGAQRDRRFLPEHNNRQGVLTRPLTEFISAGPLCKGLGGKQRDCKPTTGPISIALEELHGGPSQTDEIRRRPPTKHTHSQHYDRHRHREMMVSAAGLLATSPPWLASVCMASGSPSHGAG